MLQAFIDLRDDGFSHEGHGVMVNEVVFFFVLSFHWLVKKLSPIDEPSFFSRFFLRSPVFVLDAASGRSIQASSFPFGLTKAFATGLLPLPWLRWLPGCSRQTRLGFADRLPYFCNKKSTKAEKLRL